MAIHRTSCRWPGISTEWVLVGSVGTSPVVAAIDLDFDLGIGGGRRYVSRALLLSDRRSYKVVSLISRQ